MKRIFIPLYLVLLTSTLWGESVTVEKAQLKAADFIANTTSFSKGSKDGKALIVSLAGEEAEIYYAFNVNNNNGFVLVSASDKTRSIIGYSDKGRFDAQNAPAGLKDLIKVWNAQIAEAEQSTTVNKAKNKHHSTLLKASRTDVDAMLQTTWGQDVPFYNLCPTMTRSGVQYSCVTGCVATAMSQIIRYNEYPASGVALPSYTTRTYGLNVEAMPATTFDFSNMLDDYSSVYTTAQATAVATLMRYCGQAVEMDYSSGTSGAYDTKALSALKVMGYNVNAAFRSSENYSVDGWIDLLYNELKNNRPLFYEAQTSSGSGHAFIIDGYRASDTTFHINWGWDGVSDGYYSIYLLSPDVQGTGGSSSGYYYSMKAIVGLAKTTTDVEPETSFVSTDAANVSVASGDVADVMVVGSNASIPFTITNNDPVSDYKGRVYLSEFSYDGNQTTVTLTDVDSMPLCIAAGKTLVLNFDHVFATSGVKYLSLSVGASLSAQVVNYSDINVTTVTVNDISTNGISAVCNLTNGITIAAGKTFITNKKVSGSFVVSNSSDASVSNSYYVSIGRFPLHSYSGRYVYATDAEVLTIPASGTETIDFDYDITDTTSYRYVAYLFCRVNQGGAYSNHGLCQSTTLCTPYYTVYDGSGVATDVSIASLDDAIEVDATDALSVDLTSLSNASVTTVSDNPNCIYYLGSSASYPSDLHTSMVPEVLKGRNVAFYIPSYGVYFSVDTIVLRDDNDYFASNMVYAKNIVYKRRFNKGYSAGTGWETIALPFNVTSVRKGDGTQVSWFKSSTDENGRFWVMRFVGDEPEAVVFSHAMVMSADVPYIIAVPGDAYVSSLRLTDDTLQFRYDYTDNDYNYGLLQVSRDDCDDNSGSYYTFMPLTKSDAVRNCYVLNETGDSFRLVSSSTAVSPFRGYLTSLSSGMLGSLCIDFDNIATQISQKTKAQSAKAGGKRYNLQGMPVARHYKGVVIENNKKYVK